MLKEFKDLLPRLDELALEAELISDTFIALEEAMVNGASEVNPTAITLPNRLMFENAKNLRELTDSFYEVLRRPDAKLTNKESQVNHNA